MWRGDGGQQLVESATEHASASETGAGSFPRLTLRGQAILQLVSEGYTNVQIGLRLNVSRQTVAQQIAEMLRRTGASNRTDLVNRAHRAGVLSAEGTGPPVLITSRRA
jgi:DNA-binding NarL/FixJ family response regulator